MEITKRDEIRMELEVMIEEAYSKKESRILNGYAKGIPKRTDLTTDQKNDLVHKINNYRQVLMMGEDE